jgi:hypothetical protein
MPLQSFYPALLTGPLLATLLALALGAPARSLLLWMLASASPFAE